MRAFLNWLPLLGCGLMMLFCVGGMRRAGMFGRSKDQERPSVRSSDTADSTIDEIAQLRAEVADLRRELAVRDEEQDRG